MYGSKGVYELVYFVKESKSLERFKKGALESDRLIENKGIEETEKLVSTLFIFNLKFNLYNLYNHKNPNFFVSFGKPLSIQPLFMGQTLLEHCLMPMSLGTSVNFNPPYRKSKSFQQYFL